MVYKYKELTFTPLEDSDLNFLARLYANPVNMRDFRLGEGALPRSVAEADLADFQEHWQTYGIGMWKISHAKEYDDIGIAGFWHSDAYVPGSVAVRIMVDEPYIGKKYGTKIALACFHYAFEVNQWPEILAIILQRNTKSNALFENKIGIKPTKTIAVNSTPAWIYTIPRKLWPDVEKRLSQS